MSLVRVFNNSRPILSVYMALVYPRYVLIFLSYNSICFILIDTGYLPGAPYISGLCKDIWTLQKES